jgi:hypothetical protein
MQLQHLQRLFFLMFKIFFGSHICIKSNMVIWNLLAAAEVV